MKFHRLVHSLIKDNQNNLSILSWCWISHRIREVCKLYGKFGDVKRRITRYNLQNPLKDQITKLEQLFEHFSESNTKIRFIYISKEDLIFVRENLKNRFNTAKTVKKHGV
jgi:hypothetical protein